MQKIPIGMSDFFTILDEGYYYVDKTLMVKEVLDANAKVILLPRPRRFGKTLNLSMLNYFFENQEKNEYIFKDLAIYKEKEFGEHFGKYPVIYLTLKDIKERDFETTLHKLYSLIREEFGRYKKEILKIIDKVDDEDKDKYYRIVNNKATQDDYENSLKLLSKLLTTVYNKKAILLIDEYDTPIQTGFIKGYYDEVIDFFKTFLGAVLKDNEKYLFKSVITGILRISKESIFSDLNNLEVNTLLDNAFSDKFGFTTNEVKQMLKDYSLEDTFDEVDRWYDGYIIGENTIFNPWSLLNYINKKEFNVYWANTSSNDIIRVLVENSNGFRDDLKILLKQESVKDKVINPNITFKEKNLNFNEEMLYSFLFFSGYLKTTKKTLIEGEYICDIAIANIECKYIFKRIISNWVSDKFTNPRLRVLLKSSIEADIRLFEKIFSEFVRDTLSYFDTGKKVESVYHAFLLGLLVNLTEYEVISNQEAGYGRVDIMLFHKVDKTKPALIMELKTIDEFEEETKEKALESAVAQIIEKEYESEVKKRGYKNIVSFGVVFDGKRVWTKKLN